MADPGRRQRRADDAGSRSRTSGTAPQPAGAAMEGKETRFGVPLSALFAAATTLTSTGAVNSFHDSLHRRSAARAAGQHDARRGRARRRRLRALRDAGAGDHHGLRRRPDGRAHARSTSGKKIGAREMTLRLAVHPRPRPALVLVGTAVAMALPGAARGHAQRRPARACPRCSTPSPRRRTTTAPPSPGSPRTPPSTTSRSVWPCCSAGSCRSCSCSALAGSLARQQPVPGDRRHPADPPPAVRRAARRRA